MAKIQITSLQEEALLIFKRRGNTLDDFFRSRKEYIGNFRPLKSFTLEEMAHLLYTQDSYEIAEPYVIGDWVVWDSGTERLILEIKSVDIRASVDEFTFNKEGYASYCIKRRATTPEITTQLEYDMWKDAGREHQEFLDGDIYIDSSGSMFTVVDLPSGDASSEQVPISQAVSWFKDGDFSSFYPVGSRVTLKERK